MKFFQFFFSEEHRKATAAISVAVALCMYALLYGGAISSDAGYYVCAIVFAIAAMFALVCFATFSAEEWS